MSHPTDDVYADVMRALLLVEPRRGVPSLPTRILDHVYLGSQSNAENLGLLRSLGVSHVLNCAGYEGPRPSPHASPYGGAGDIDYHEFQAEDADDYDICRHFPEAFAFLDRAAECDPAPRGEGPHRGGIRGGVALVHCVKGVNRSAAVCLAYLMIRGGLTLLGATRVLRERRGGPLLTNKHFQRLLVEYARSRGLLDDLEAPDREEQPAVCTGP